MAQKTVSAHKTLGKGFTNEVQTIKLTYDFASDGGATTDTYVLGTTGGKILVLNAIVHVKTAATSGGSATVKIGVSGVDDDAFMTAVQGAVASLTADATVKEAVGQKFVCASGAKIEATIGTAALTAGKINLVLEYMNID